MTRQCPAEPRRYCPLTVRHPEDSPCCTNCALFQHEGCSIAILAGSLYGIMQALNELAGKVVTR